MSIFSLRANRTMKLNLLHNVIHDVIILMMSCYRSNPPEVFLGKRVLKICSKFTREHPCWIAISIKLLCNFIEITLRHGCSPINLLHIFRTLFSWEQLRRAASDPNPILIENYFKDGTKRTNQNQIILIKSSLWRCANDATSVQPFEELFETNI